MLYYFEGDREKYSTSTDKVTIFGSRQATRETLQLLFPAQATAHK